MKKALFLIPALLLGAPLSPAAPQVAETYEAAKQIVTDDGIIIFAYADGWDHFGKRVCEKLMTSPEVLQAAGDAVFMRAPIPNFIPTEEQEKQAKETYGELNLPNARSYPALFFFTKSGRACSIVYGPFMRKAAPKKVAALIRERLAGMKKQEELLAQAEKADGISKAKLLGEASSIPGIDPPEHVNKIINRIKQLDPQDTTGYARNLRIPNDLIEEIVGIERDKSKGWQEALKKVESELKDPIYNTSKKQYLHALAIGLLHRHGSVRDVPKIREHIKAMRDLDPHSVLGRSASLAEREFCSGFNLAEGWTPAVVQGDGPVELEAPHPVGPAGSYTFTFIYERGRHACGIQAVSVFDGDKLVAEDRHAGSTGIKNNNNVYQIQIPAALKDPHVFIEFNQEGNKDPNGAVDSYGHISISRK